MNAILLTGGQLPAAHRPVLTLALAHPNWTLAQLAEALALAPDWVSAVARTDFFQAHLRAAERDRLHIV